LVNHFRVNSYNYCFLAEATLARLLLGWRFKTIAQGHFVQTKIHMPIIILVAIAARVDLEWSKVLNNLFVTNLIKIAYQVLLNFGARWDLLGFVLLSSKALYGHRVEVLVQQRGVLAL
jgi:hypothetical protein